MKILFAASEAAPFAKSGGLGDVAQALPTQLAKNKNVEVRVVIPYYKRIKDNPEINPEFVTSFGVDLSWRRIHVGIFKTTYKKVTYYFVDNEYYFARDTFYGHFDDGERFAYFSKAVLEMISHIDFVPDVIHTNDWQTALIPVYLKGIYAKDPLYQGIRTVFTIHNIEYQGKMPNEFFKDVIGLDEGMRSVLTYDGCINFMKAAIVLCDKLTTVSETYSYEIRYPYFSHGLSEIIKENEYKIEGIVNGIDTDIYNPAKDKYIQTKYKSGELSKKAKNKEYLQKKLGLEVNPDIPVVAIISRLVSHKGLDLVERVLNEIMGLNVEFVVLGTGDKRFEDMFNFTAYNHPSRMASLIKFDPILASEVYAGADILLMPSKSEPCGLSQLIAMRYGTIPVVRETGGLNDTVPPVNTETLEGRGFTFKGYNAHDMLDAISRAVNFYYDKPKYEKLVKSIMDFNSDWTISAAKYVNIYKSII